MTRRDWMPVADAAAIVDRGVDVVYKWLRRPEPETKIRRMRPRGVTYVHIPSLLEYEATIRPGRPRKADQ